MITTEYIKPGDLSDLHHIMEEYKGRATVIAGGTNLIPEMRNGEKAPELLIDISDMAELSFIRENNGSIAIAFMGDYQADHPTDEQICSAGRLACRSFAFWARPRRACKP